MKSAKAILHNIAELFTVFIKQISFKSYLQVFFFKQAHFQNPTLLVVLTKMPSKTKAQNLSLEL